MNKLNIFILCIIAVMLIAIFTNPSRQDYINWAQDVAEQEMAQEMDPNSILDSITGLVSRSIINNYLHTSTKLSNYLFFSIYRTDFGDAYIVALGIFGHFIVLNMAN
ncbi:DUF4359 domain-containing protein [Mahella australiensis]|uniref:Lipoprotein n=1 Tax=Mahella australiensis (strain DSM 15567 / CIP 107919 / 50-1 BON) TaxID=697281 RepID=F3ZXK5_MAHA5|nr:DUF4359 domain-containing protein [Mahella australiensis]AEE97686.1 lipoprotein [Mahella australiensis 50-1 BON]